MASRIEHRATFSGAVAGAYAAQSDEAALRARLSELGGVDAALESHTSDDDGARYTLRQGVPAEKLPQAVRKLHRGDLIVRREHMWQRRGTGYTGTITAQVSGVPGEITARTELRPDGASGTGAVQHTRGEVTISIPFVGSKLEGLVAEQVTMLLEREAEFTAAWLARGS